MDDFDKRIEQLDRAHQKRLYVGGDEGGGLPPIAASPFALPDPASIPPRRWLLGKWLQRGELSAMIAPGGVGKTTFEVGLALSLASGKDLFDRGLPEGPRRVWFWNLEDDAQELARQFAAAALHHQIGASDIDGRLFVDGLDQKLCTAIETADGAQILEPVYEAVTRELRRRKIDVLKIDPFVSSHAVNENDNGKIDAIAKRWKRVAQDCDCAILLVHHSRKTGGNAVTAEDSRGASSLSGAVRTVLTLNPMSEEEGNRYGITEKADRRTIIRVDNGKSNRAPPENAFWFKLHSVDLGNGNGLSQGDQVGAAAIWQAPDPFEGLSVRDLYNVQHAIAGGDYAANVQASDWVGRAVADALGLDAGDKKDKGRISSLLASWINSGALAVEKRKDKAKGRERPFVVVGNWIKPDEIPTSKSGVGTGGGSGEIPAQNPTPPHPPYRGGRGGGVGEGLGAGSGVVAHA
ncbi:AAA family ATPase [Porphyrobacter sp. CACIAM 03H1]|uniref:AAA family ATPase n=1 Tax=Porphyrobacter sp. CACIAM 03H1 TaxID=2003315 RepID=UPI000B5A70C6|nr:AAA family ATPase [Porphyrobacter sp. CACIAM 03H1]ASJ91262.1 recombinase RecA [Porphyrobacter sp. CACIAM 03H1]